MIQALIENAALLAIIAGILGICVYADVLKNTALGYIRR